MNIREEILAINEEALVITADFDDAIIGMASRINFGPVVAYDVEKIIKILVKDMEVDKSELEEGETVESKKYGMAREYYEYNIVGAFIDEMMPVFVETEGFERNKD